MNATVLLVEDDPRLSRAIQDALELDLYEVIAVENGREALESLETRTADVIVSDVMMPEIDGIQLCRTLRDQGNRTPLLLLTARHLVSDRVAGLDAGADDYLAKPFALEELLARVRALLRRSTFEDEPETVTIGDITLNLYTRSAIRAGREIVLSKTEFDLLELFMQNPNRVLTREIIFDRVWGYDLSLNSNSLEVFVGNLRRKLESDGGSRLIYTSRGVGYALRTS